MHTLFHLLAASTTATTKAKSSSSGSSTYAFLIIIVLFALVYILFLRPRQQRFKQQQQAAKTLDVGDEVVSAGGIHGRVVALDADVAEVEVAPGVVLTFMRRAISTKPGTKAPAAPEPVDDAWEIPAPSAADEPAPEPEDGHWLVGEVVEPDPASEESTGGDTADEPPGPRPETDS